MIKLVDQMTNGALRTQLPALTGRPGGNLFGSLEEQLRKLSQAVEQSPSMVIITNKGGAIEYVNPKFCQVTGYSPEEIKGQNPRLLKSGDLSADEYQRLWSTIQAGKEWRGEFRNRKKSGEKYWVGSAVSAIRNEFGEITHYLAVQEDITEKKLLESQFLRAQRLESIGTLASGIAHDLNNVLSPILMASHLIRMGPLTEEGQKMLQTVEAAAQRGADMVKQVLMFARGVAGDRIPIQPQRVINEVVKIMREVFPRNISIEVNLPEKLLPISGDFTQLHQLLLNLCVNARDAMPGGGKIVLSARNLFLDEQATNANREAKAGPYVLLEISDTGTGIPAAIIDKVFDPFFTTKEHGKGTGLGLSTVIGIAKSHGGYATVESQVGEGSTFKVFLPAILEPERASSQSIQAPQARGHGEVVLVVDDEPGIRKVTGDTLRQHGYNVLLAANGAEALAMFEANRSVIKLVLVDIMMPGMDGLALARVLKTIDPALKVIASSGLEEETKALEFQEIGVMTFLAKPYTADRLLAALSELFQER